MKITTTLLLLSALGGFSVASAQTGPATTSQAPASATRVPGTSDVPSTSTTGPGIPEESSGAIRGHQQDRTGIYNPYDTDTSTQQMKSKRGTQPLPSDTSEKDSGSDPLSAPAPRRP